MDSPLCIYVSDYHLDRDWNSLNVGPDVFCGGSSAMTALWNGAFIGIGIVSPYISNNTSSRNEYILGLSIPI